MPFDTRKPAVARITSSVLLVAYCVASFGFIPSPRSLLNWFGLSPIERYPCEDCGCGCVSAHECWTHCCCHSEHQRLVWAIQNGVLPPEGVEFSDQQWIAAANVVKPGSATCGACVARIERQLSQGIATPSEAQAASCCQDSNALLMCATESGGDSSSVEDACCSSGPSPIPGGGKSPLACKGKNSMIVLGVPPSPPVTSAAKLVLLPAVQLLPRAKDAFCESRSLETPVPPPRTR